MTDISRSSNEFPELASSSVSTTPPVLVRIPSSQSTESEEIVRSSRKRGWSNQFSKMNDSELEECRRFMMQEFHKRNMEDPGLAPPRSPTPPLLNSSVEFRSPKKELLDDFEETRVRLDANNPGITFNLHTQSYEYNDLPIHEDFQNILSSARLTNIMNGVVDKDGNAVKKPRIDSRTPPSQPENVENEKVDGREARRVSEWSKQYWSTRDEKKVNCKCSVCGFECKTIRELLDHRLDHGEDVMLKCWKCPMKFHKRNQILLHLNKEFNVYVCRKCHNSFSNANCLEKHEASCNANHNEDPRGSPAKKKNKACPTCFRTYSSEKWIARHIEDCCPGEKYVVVDGAEKENWKPVVRVEREVVARPANRTDDRITRSRSKNGQYVAETKLTEEEVIEKDVEARFDEALDDSEDSALSETNPPAQPNPENNLPDFSKGCPFCGQNVTSLRQRERHFNDCQREWECTKCKEVFGKWSLLSSHQRLCQAEDAIYLGRHQCLRCKRNFQTERGKKNHEIQCKGKMKNDDGSKGKQKDRKSAGKPINVPDGSANDTQNVDDDIIVDAQPQHDYSSPAAMTIFCNLCGGTFPTVTELLKHRKSHGDQFPSICTVCNCALGSASTIRRHTAMEFHLYECPVCTRNCMDASTLRNHICNPEKQLKRNQAAGGAVKTMPRKNKVFNCGHCSAGFASATAVYHHLSRCRKNEKNKGSFRTKMEKKENFGAYSDSGDGCDYTDYLASFEQKEGKETMELDEDDSNQPGPSTRSHQYRKQNQTRLKCFECDEIFKRREHIVAHRKKVHGLGELECSCCRITFNNPRTLHDHYVVKAGTFKCICGHAFGREYQLEHHLIVCEIVREQKAKETAQSMEVVED